MSNTLNLVLILLLGSVSGLALAGDSHTHEHGMSEKSDMAKKMKSYSLGVGHDMKHMHDSEGSRVGWPAPHTAATKKIHVIAKDTMRYEFSPESMVEAGEIVTFVITNEGKLVHEFSIGDKAEQKAHRKMMQKMPDMIHEDGNTITLKPGETKSLTWKFKGKHQVVFACNIPGHFEAGMFHNMKIQQKQKVQKEPKLQKKPAMEHDMSGHHH